MMNKINIYVYKTHNEKLDKSNFFSNYRSNKIKDITNHLAFLAFDNTFFMADINKGSELIFGNGRFVRHIYPEQFQKQIGKATDKPNNRGK